MPFTDIAHTSKPQVLLVDDLVANLQVLVAGLQDEFSLKTATSGASALNLLERLSELPKLVVLDVKMPGMNGIEVLRRMRKDPRTMDIPIILISADASEQNEITGLNVGANDYLVKPVSPKVLSVRARNLIQRSAEHVQLRLAAHVFENSGEGIMINDRNNEIVDVNNAFTKLTGYSKNEVLGMNPRFLSSGRTPPEEYQRMWDAIVKDGFWQGELWDRRKDGSVYPKLITISVVRDRAGVIEYYLANFVDISHYKNTEERIEQLAHHDALTGLPNRLQLQVFLEQSMLIANRMSEQIAVMFLDLDRFKTINDTLGHPTGDELLIQAAARIKACVRDYDMAARLGGDEFVVILRGHDIQTAAFTVAEKIRDQIAKAFRIEQNLLHTSASVGIAIYPDNSQRMDDLMRNADTAMYFAKAEGGNGFRFYSTDMNIRAHEKLELENLLHGAIENNQLELYYQPQMDSSKKLLGAEALIRWKSPERGLISPADFIPLAEATGLILAIGQWVLDTACAQLKVWQQSEVTRHLMLAVNVSAKQFRQPAFVDQVRATVQFHGVNPGLLKLELTESMLIDNVDATIADMLAIKQIGVKISLDDFGTGYSSLQYLKRLPLDQIKIDQSFVRNIGIESSDDTIVMTIIGMSAGFGLDVIAEGVETEAQFEFLSRHGCNKYQGYLFGKPVPIDQFQAFITNA